MTPLSRRSLTPAGIAAAALLLVALLYTRGVFRSGLPPIAGDPANAIRDLAAAGDAQRLAPYVNNPDLSLALAAVSALGQVGNAQAAATLVEAVNDPRPDVQAAALTALGNVKPDVPIDRAIAINILNDLARPVQVRAAALQMLGARKVYHCLPDLIAPLNDKDPLIRAKAYATIKVIFCKDYGYHANDPEDRRLEMMRRIQADFNLIDWHRPNIPE